MKFIGRPQNQQYSKLKLLAMASLELVDEATMPLRPAIAKGFTAIIDFVFIGVSSQVALARTVIAASDPENK